MTPKPCLAVRVEGVSHRYGKTHALDDVSLDVGGGELVGFIGPDGVGKSSLLALISGARRIQSGTVEALGGDMALKSHRKTICPRIAYMPQGLGKNLYMDLSVAENLEFFGRLFGQGRSERRERIAQLLKSTGLAAFPHRLVGKLSGGMKQKLGLCCALIHDPDLLILDEPTTGVDPLSRRRFWSLIAEIRKDRPGMSVLVATAYMEEAEQFDRIVVMNDGAILANGRPADVMADQSVASLDAAFISLLPEAQRYDYRALSVPQREAIDGEPAIVAEGLTRRFGKFTAVDHVSFRIETGEIFGFLGSNGCGKTTTMKMLTGLLPPTEGEAWLFGELAKSHDLETRKRVGYMSQSFSLYTELTVRQNLELHARLYHLPRARIQPRVDEVIDRFGLADYEDVFAEKLPLGVRQRLSLAVAVIHEPEILILDEPTSGVDPIARDEFWRLLVDLSRNQGVTIFISTHFMNEATRCDRISLMHAGKVLASGTPEALGREQDATTLEETFIAYLEAADVEDAAVGETEPTTKGNLGVAQNGSARRPPSRVRPFSLRRLFAYSRRETSELVRDPIRLAFALLGTAVLMLVFSYGITFDVEDLTYAVFDRDRTPESRTYVEGLAGSRYFDQRDPIESHEEMDRRLNAADITLALEIPPGFGRDLLRGQSPKIAAWIDGAMPYRAETIEGYLQGLHHDYLEELQRRARGEASVGSLVEVQSRYRYNQDFKSVYALVPINICLILVFIPAVLTALGVVREKELGSITNLYVTPVTRTEFLVGKQLPYIGVGMISFFFLTFLAVTLFDVPIKGSFLALALGALLYVTATTGLGLLISSFTKTQIAALFGTAIGTMLPATQFSGMMQPVASLEGPAAFIGQIFPTTYFVRVSVGSFTKALSLGDLATSLMVLALYFPILLLLSVAFLRKQER